MINPKLAREELKDILNQHEYRVYYNRSKSFLEIWWEKAKQWMAQELSKLFPSIKVADSAAVPVLIAVIVVVVILLALTVFIIFRNVRRNRIFRNQNPLQSMKEMNWSFRQHLTEATRLEALEQYTLSIRHLFLAVLLYFHEKGWLEARIWKTNWEYYDELRKINEQDAEQFFNLAALFDEVTYGERTVEQPEFLQFQTIALKWLNTAEPLHEREAEKR